MAEDCIFCKIANKEIPSNVVYEDDSVLAFNDLEPQAPVHVLVIPKAHFDSVSALGKEGKEVAGHIVAEVIPEIAKKLGILESGFRVVANTGADGGQTVMHLHFHVLGGRSLQWPPG